MKVVVDSSVLLYLLYPDADAPLDPATGKPVDHCAERIEGLIDEVEKTATLLILPTPVLSELLIKAGSRQLEILNVLTNRRAVSIAGFDQMAAVENAQLRRSKQMRQGGGTKKEVSFDLQVLAIARVAGADLVLSDDIQLRTRCAATGMKTAGVANIPVPDNKRQIQILYSEPNDIEEDDVRGAPIDGNDTLPDESAAIRAEGGVSPE